jgi:hypothetical protein
MKAEIVVSVKVKFRIYSFWLAMGLISGQSYDRSKVNQMFLGFRFSCVSQFRVIFCQEAGFFGKQ